MMDIQQKNHASGHTPVGIAHVGLDGRWLWMNDRFATILGYTRADLLRRRYQDLTAPEDIDESETRVQALLADQIPSYATQKRYLHKDGSQVWVHLTTTMVRDPEGHPLYRLQLIEDITARKLAERQVEWLVQGAPDALLIVDGTGRIRQANRQATRLLGYDHETLLQLPVEALVPAGVHGHHQQYVREYVRGPRSRPMGLGLDVSARQNDGTEIPVAISLNPLQREGELLIAVTIRDMRQEQELRRQLQTAQKMQAMARLAAGVAHDFNNQLTGILGYSEMLLSQIGPDKPMGADLREIHKAATRSADLTRQLLAFTRQQVFQLESLDLTEVLGNTAKMLQRVLGEDIRLELHLASDLRRVEIDVSQLEHVVTNLAINARDAMPRGGTLTMTTANVDVNHAYAASHTPIVPGPYVAMTVQDTGIGMDATTKARIFEPFFTTKASGQGTGLGLSTVFGILKQLKGFIWVDSAPNEGTTFTIHLPVTEKPASGRGLAPEPRAAAVGTETLLVVEDEDSVRQLTVTVLRRHGYRVLEAATPRDALAILQQPPEPIALVITDIVMPEMTGPELIAHLGDEARFQVLYMSGYADPVQIGHDIGDDGHFLAKPFSVPQLLDHVRGLLGTPGACPANI